MRNRPLIVSWVLLGSILQGVSLFSQLDEPKEQLLPAMEENFVYFNEDMRLRLEGPEGWYGGKQDYDLITGLPVYQGVPPGTQALYVKYPIEKEPLYAYNPTYEVRILKSRSKGSSSLMELEKYISEVPRKDIMLSPTTFRFEGREWATAEFKIEALLEKKPISLVGKVYLLLKETNVFLVQVTITEAEFREDLSLFDTSVRKIAFLSEE